ncbi:MAG: tetratricopeptide repeat protein [Chloroflexia bacterium]
MGGSGERDSEVLAMDPEDIAAFNRLGRSLTKLGRLRDALDAYTRATTVDAANAIALRNSTRLRAILETAGTETVEAANPSELRADHFIMETGRSAVLELENLAPVAGLATVLPGDVLEIPVRWTVPATLHEQRRAPGYSSRREVAQDPGVDECG